MFFSSENKWQQAEKKRMPEPSDKNLMSGGGLSIGVDHKSE